MWTMLVTPVASKIRYLQEYHNRVLHNIYPVPSGTDIANTLKYFSQTLLSILSRTGKKENQDASNLTVPMTMCLFPVPFPLTPSLRPQVSSINPTVTRSLLYSVLRDAPSERGLQSRDAHLSDYPSLDYQGLYVTLVTLLDLVPLLQHGQHVGSSRREGVPAHVNLSASSMLMIAMQYTSNPVYHCQLLECLMKYKQEVWKDLLYVIAYGPSQVKPPAVQMLFHYWPNLKPPGAISEYRGLQYTAWNPIHCQHIECHNAINKPAVKMCIDPSLSVALGDKPPPLYLCEECSQRIAGDHSEWLIDVLLPQAEISAICQKKNCSSHVRRAVVTCFSAGCCGRHGNRPVRYCKRCHSNHHSNEVGAASETHLYQTSPPPINTRECGAEELVCAVEAVISLLKEAEFHAEQREYELNRRRQLGLSSSHHSLENADFDNKDDDKHDQRLLSQFGIWFLVSLCTPSENTPTESLARLVAMVFQWFHSTAYMMDDEVGSLVEKLKPQFVTKWLKTVCDVRFDVMVMCLLPKPMEFARVGGYWDKSCSTVTQLKEGLNRILCLIPYNVINQSVWECIMPEWLEAIRTEVPDNQLKEFREVLSKMFDIELCPLPFSMEEMFGFISCRFTGYPSSVQEQALLWLHVLSELDIMVPLQLLISMFSDGVNSVKELANQRKSRVNELAGNLAARRVSVASDPGRRVQHNMLSPFHSPFQSPFRSPMRSPFRSPFKNFGHPGGRTIDFDCEDDEMNLNCFILMFDLLLKQMELQDDGITMGLEHSLSKDIISIINNVFQAPWGGSHTCQKDEKAIECNLCQSSILCYQLACELLERLAPKEESRLVEPTDSLEDSLLSSRPEFIIGPEGEEEENPATKHGENPGNRTEPSGHAAYIQDHMLIASLWRVVKSEFSQLSSLAVPLLLHALSLPHGADIFWTIINGNFNSKDWKMRFEAVTKNHLLKYSLAHAFCCFLTAVEDVNPAVATRAGLLLDTIKRPALQQDIPALSWEFFVNRFETLSLEAQLHLDCNKEFPFPTTITAVRTNVANLSDTALWKIKRARFARNRQKSVRSLRDSVKGPAESKRALSLPETLTSKIRQQSPENDNTIKDLLPEDAGIDHQTVHQLITVLMKFMAKDESSAESDISSAKAFNTVKRHLYVLLGYDQQEGCFMIAPQKMRLSTCFNAFIAGIAQVMDYNINLGKHLLPLVVQVLKYCSCPQLRHYFQQPPRCSLWPLKPHIRQMWLKALLVILYKYPYRDCDISKVLLHLIHITVNTLNAQYHSCKPHAAAGPLYSDYSNVSRYSEKEKGEIELAEYRETGAVQDSILHCVREESIQKKKLRSLKQKSLDIGNADSLLFTLDEHRRKSCIDRCDIDKPPAQAAYITQRQHDHGRPRQNSATRPDTAEAPENSAAGGFQEMRRPVIPEVRLNCMETFEVKVDSPIKPAPKEDLDLIDLSSDSTSGPEKHSMLSTSDSDSLVFEPLPPLRIVESDEEEETMDQGNDGASGKNAASSPSIPSHPSVLSLSTTPLVQTSLDDNPEPSIEEDTLGGLMPSSGAKTVLLKVPEDAENPTESEKPDTSAESDTEQTLERKVEEEGAEESEFKIQIVPRQRKQRKIAVSAIQREYLDISFNILDKLGEQKDPAQYRQMKRGSLGALTMSQLMKRQLEHQSSAPHNISNWDTEQIQPGKRQCNVPMCLNPDLEGQPLRMRGATKSSLLSAPSIVSMFVPAPEEFTDEQPTVMTDKCHDCGAILEEYDEETLGLAIVVLSTFIHLSPDLAAPLLLDIMQSVGRLASSTTFSNQAESMMVPGNAAGVAKQFLRCILHQLAPNGIFPQLFQSTIKDGTFLRTLATSLMDFNELSSIAALSQLLEGLNNKKNLPAGGAMIRCLENIATFMEALPMDSPSSLWTTISNQFQTFFAKLPCVLPLKCSLDSSLRIMICLLKIPSTNATRSLLEPFSKLLSFVIQNAVFTLAYLVEVCGLCYRAFTKERDKLYLSRSVVLELLQALKLKSPLPDTNLLLLVQSSLGQIAASESSDCWKMTGVDIGHNVVGMKWLPLYQDAKQLKRKTENAGTKLAESTILSKQMIASVPGCGTAAMECMRQYISEVLDFMADMHTLTKLKSHMKTCSQPLHEDTFGGHLKVGLAQIAAMEISRGNHRDNKAVIRYLPWLYHPPSAMQQGPKEFIECVSHIRLLSWLLLGSLTHNAVCPNASSPCLPIPLDAGSHIADHLIVILIGFPEQSKTSVLHMCSLFHAFIFAQLWTVYCEQSAVAPNVQSQNEFSFTAILTALEFWSRVTPSILQLMAHNKVHLSAGLQLRLQAIQNNVNHHSLRTLPGSAQSGASLVALRKWLQCTQFKMAQVEIQSSEAASQFYPL
ncbi:Protein unc-79 like protein [Pteropus alecto]|uniref:Protein unc-79 like protein n=1 Tax=Pteropus alecto TaxID=9402 RepID=L5JP67_PTEAL|nr:Protein unc-79 like protein [Pteropus alecto]